MDHSTTILRFLFSFFQFPFGCFPRQIRSIVAAFCAEYGHPTTPSNESMKRIKISLRLKTTPLSRSDRDIVQQHFHALFEFILHSSNFELNPIVTERGPQPPNGNTLRFYHITYFSRRLSNHHSKRSCFDRCKKHHQPTRIVYLLLIFFQTPEESSHYIHYFDPSFWFDDF